MPLELSFFSHVLKHFCLFLLQKEDEIVEFECGKVSVLLGLNYFEDCG